MRVCAHNPLQLVSRSTREFQHATVTVTPHRPPQSRSAAATNLLAHTVSERSRNQNTGQVRTHARLRPCSHPQSHAAHHAHTRVATRHPKPAHPPAPHKNTHTPDAATVSSAPGSHYCPATHHCHTAAAGRGLRQPHTRTHKGLHRRASKGFSPTTWPPSPSA